MSGAIHLNDLGIVCALGAGKEDVARSLFNGDTGVCLLDDAVTDGSSLPFAPVTVPLSETPETLSKFSSRNLSLALTALEDIDKPVRSAIERYGADRVAVVMGTSTSGISEGEAALGSAEMRSSGCLPEEFDFVCQEIGSVAESIAIHYGLATPAITVSTACSSGAKALATGRRMLRASMVDAVIAGGCDSRCALTLNGFHALSALTTTACLPFSADRDGTMIGEGAAVFLMTREQSGPVLLGVGESSDAHNMTAPQPEGTGATAAMRAALDDAGLRPEDICYVNLHGTATNLNDAMESRALSEVYPGGVACSSSKAQVGHTLGAAGAIEAAICWLTLMNNPEARLPPHVSNDAVDEDAHVPTLVTGVDRLPPERRWLMSNSYAFGGSNISVVIGADA